MLPILFILNIVVTATAYTSRPSVNDVLKDYEQALEPKLQQHKVQKEMVIEGLPTQAAYFENKNSKTLVLIQSGIHGTETSAGSFLQQIFLSDYFQKYWDKGHSIVLVHAYNGWGFLNNRRFTENGVDLNRNHDITEELFKTKNEKFKHIRHYLLNEGKVNHPSWGLFWISIKFMFANIKEKWLNKFTTDDFREALGNGQYEFPKEIGFGGQAFEPQTLWAQKRLPEIFKKYKKIMVIDFHTGLGEKGHLHLILSGRESAEEKKKIAELFKKGVSEKSYEVNTGDSEGFYFTNGDYLAFARKLNPEAKIIAFAAEYGTMGLSLPQQIQTISRLVLENQGHWQGYGSDEAKAKTQKHLLDLFTPNEKDWWVSVEQKGRALFDDTLSALNQEW